MAVKNRADLQLSIDTNIPDNTTEAITPATHRAVEEDLKDSNYNLLDNQATDVTYNPGDGANWVDPDPTEVGGALDDLAGRVTTIEGEPNQTAFETPYTPTTPAEWNPEEPLGPTEVRRGLDILAARTGVNRSQSIAYVSNTGLNPGVTAEVGNPLKPYTSITAAIGAVNATYSKVIVMGGTYNEDVILSNKDYFTLELRNTIINGRVVTTSTSDDVTIEATGSRINGDGVNYALAIGGKRNIVNGGYWVTGGTIKTFVGQATTEDCIITNAKFEQTGTRSCVENMYNFKILNCTFISNGASFPTMNTLDNVFFGSNTVIRNVSGAQSMTVSAMCVFKDCSIYGYVDERSTLNTVSRFENCRIESPTYAIILDGDAQVYCKDCILIGGTYAVDLTQLTGINQSWFENCILYGVTDTFNEPASYGVTGQKVYSIKCTYDKNYTPVTVGEQRLFEFDKTEITDLVIPPALIV